MNSVQRELTGVLLDRIRSLGFISDSTYSGAVNLIHSTVDFPDFFPYPAGLAAEETEPEGPQRQSAAETPPSSAIDFPSAL